MVENQHFFAGVLARHPLDFLSFSAAGNHIFFAEAAGLTRLVLSILRHSTNNSCCEEKPVAHRCSAPPVALVDFAISRFVVWLLCPIIIHLNFISLIRTN